MTPSSLPSTIPTLARCGYVNTGCAQSDNVMAQCLKDETALWAKIAFNPIFATLKLPARYRTLLVPPFDAQPVDATRLNIQGVVGPLSTLVANTYNTVVQYLVPAGYDGVINSTFNKFTPQAGPGLQDGSGMVTWAVAINNYLQLNYTNITMQMGGTVTLGPMPYGGGIRIKANDLITMYAMVTAAGIAYLDPAGLILGALQGWVFSSR